MELRSISSKYKNSSEVTVVSSSSRSPTTMSSNELPRTPSPVPLGTEKTRDESSGQSTTGVSSGFREAASTAVDFKFIENHLKSPPSITISRSVRKHLDDIKNAKNERSMYNPAGKALTAISKEFFNAIKDTPLKAQLLKKHKYLKGRLTTALTFIDHHSNAPTHFPDDHHSDPVKDAPDLLAVYKPTDFTKSAEGKYRGVPHHRVVGIIEAKPRARGGGRAQAAAYAYRHQQARPDHPMLFCLIVKPQWYQVILSSPNGIVASRETPWDDLELLLAYVYSHYDPRDDHFLHDDTVSWNAPNPASSRPSWSFVFRGQTYTGYFVFVGDPWGRRTMVFRVYGVQGDALILKESYRRRNRRFKEEVVLAQIHRDGDVPGVVRLKDWEYVHTDGQLLQIGSGDDARIKVRHTFYDYGEPLLKAKSVNDLLEVFYDALETHRTIYIQRRVLHRDMSAYNILIYPQWPKIKDRKVLESAPPLIRDLLDGLRPLEDRVAACLMIDTDNAALLDSDQTDGELAHRTGTPMFIARSVCAGKYFRAVDAEPMPQLLGEAKDMYIKAHGQERYDRYAEKDSDTCHGCIPPSRRASGPSVFTHRPEHDAESVGWTMLYTLLRVRPETFHDEKKWAPHRVANIWDAFHKHAIDDEPDDTSEQRTIVFQIEQRNWPLYFPPEMADIAMMMYRIMQQVLPEYAYWPIQPPEDHLHEAMQRIILQYLVDHRNKDIKLNPNNLRPTKRASAESTAPNEVETQRTTEDMPAQQSMDSGDNISCTTSCSQSKNTSASKADTTGRGSKDTPPIVAGSSSRSRHTWERTSESSSPIVMNIKRKSENQGSRQSKRLKVMAGVAIDEEDEEDHQG